MASIIAIALKLTQKLQIIKKITKILENSFLEISQLPSHPILNQHQGTTPKPINP